MGVRPWGHYADSNKGIVLGFEFVSKKFHRKGVDYIFERKKISIDQQNFTKSDYIEAIGFIKYKKWEYEKEHRFFVKLDECTQIEEDYFLKYNNDLKLRKVIIGPENPSLCKNYKQKAKYIIDLVKQTGAELIVSRQELGGYRIVRCGTWTPKFEELLNT